MIKNKSTLELVKIVEDSLDYDNYHGIDDIQSIKISIKNKTATIVIGLIEVPEDNYIGLVGY